MPSTTRNNLLLVSLALWTVCGAAGRAVAHPGSGPGPGGHRGNPWARAAAELDLSEAQKKQMQEIESTQSAAFERLRGEADEARGRFMAAMKRVDSTTEALTKAHEDMLAARAALMRARFERMLAMRSILSKPQLEEFLGKLEKLGAGRHGWPRGSGRLGDDGRE